MSESQAVTNAIVNSYNPDYESFDICISDQHAEILNHLILRSLGTATIGTDTEIDDTVIAFAVGHGINNGEYICFREGERSTQALVLNVATNDITIDTPLDFAYTTAATVTRGSANMAVNGASTPVLFMCTPPDGVTWDITQLNISILDGTEMGDGLFGGITALTRGCYLRVINGINKNIGNIKRNLDFRVAGMTLEYSSKPPAGQYGLTATAHFSNDSGVVLRISSGEYLVIGIQDDLSELTSMTATVGGHKVVP